MAEGIQAAGNLITGVASYESGKFNRGMSRVEATEAARAGTVEEGRVRDAARMAIGQQLAAQGSNGFQMGAGSAIDALTQSQINATVDALTVRQSAAARARAARVQGDIAYAQGSNALVQGMLGATATAVDWASQKRAARAGTTPNGGGGRPPVWGQPGHEDRHG